MSQQEWTFEFPRDVDYPVGLVFEQDIWDGSGPMKWIVTAVVSPKAIKAKALEQ